MTEFISKEPTKALNEVKEILTERLVDKRRCYQILIKTRLPGLIEVDDEIDFLEKLLDIIEEDDKHD